MQTSVHKWGNSLAIRLPKAFADQIRVGENTLVDISLIGEGILVARVDPEEPARFKLTDLLSQITKENLHDEMDGGSSSIGNEAW